MTTRDGRGGDELFRKQIPTATQSHIVSGMPTRNSQTGVLSA